MKATIKPTQSDTKLANLEKIAERENWHKLVVKVISWKSGLLEGGSVKTANKITNKEWNLYCDRLVKTNTTYGKPKVLADLKEIKKLIKEHGGFESSSI